MLQRVPQADDILFLVHRIQCCCRIGRLDRLDADDTIKKVDTLLIDFDRCYVKPCIFRIATKNAHPWSDFQQSATLLVLKDGLHAIRFPLRYRSKLRQVPWNGLIAAMIKRRQIVRNGIEEDEAAGGALIKVKN